MNSIKIYSQFFDLFNEVESHYFPITDIIENESDFEYEVAAPGFNKSDFIVKIENDSLIISGEKKKNEKIFSHRESFQKTFKRSFTLPKEVKVDEITATYIDGILTIRVPKDTVAIKNKLIEVL